MFDAEIVQVLKALADPMRFRMVQEIAARGELSCGEVKELFDVSQPTISHHLKILADAGVLVMRGEGKRHFTSVNHALLGAIALAVPARLAPNAKRVPRAERSRSASAPRKTRAKTHRHVSK